METGQDLQTVIYPQDGFDLEYSQWTGSIASETYWLRAEAALLTFSNSQTGQFFPISPYPGHRKFPSRLPSSVPELWTYGFLGSCDSRAAVTTNSPVHIYSRSYSLILVVG